MTNERIKAYLINKQNECLKVIKKRKKKNKIIKIVYGGLITISIIGSSLVLILSSLTIPPLSIVIISNIITISTVISIKFKLSDKKDKLRCNIQKLNEINNKLEYIINCNGDLTEEECNKILKEFYNL